MGFKTGYDCVFDQTAGVCKFGAALNGGDMNNKLVWTASGCGTASALFMAESMTTEDAAVYLFAAIGLAAIGMFSYKQFLKFRNPTGSEVNEMTTYDTVT